MTQTSIQTQIEVIKKASANARRSKESALKFLIDAGIIKSEEKTKQDGQTFGPKKK